MRPYLLAPRFAANRLWLAAREVPSWHIAPVRTGTVTDLISGSQIITFTNSSPAWGFNSSGLLVQPTSNVPFIEYDPETGACLGWRVWDAVTNLRSYSEAVLVANGYGATNSTLTTQSVSTPIQGVSSASLFALNSGANTGNNTDGMVYGSGLSLANSTAYTQSGFFKLSETNTIRLRSNVTGQVFDIVPASGATTPSGTITACTVQAAPNGWYRVSWSFTSTTSVPGNRGDHWTIKTPVADGTTGFWITGTQINTGPLAPYVPTGALTASSTADVASILSWAAANNIRSAYIRGRTTATGTRGLLSGNDNSSSNRIEAITSGTDPRLQVTTSGSGVADIDGGTVVANTPFRMAMRFAPNDFALSVDGGAVVTDTSGALPTIDRWFLGRTQAGGDGNCYIDEMALFTNGLGDSRLIAMGGV